jgi:hypothetical protein
MQAAARRAGGAQVGDLHIADSHPGTNNDSADDADIDAWARHRNG